MIVRPFSLYRTRNALTFTLARINDLWRSPSSDFHLLAESRWKIAGKSDLADEKLKWDEYVLKCKEQMQLTISMPNTFKTHCINLVITWANSVLGARSSSGSFGTLGLVGFVDLVVLGFRTVDNWRRGKWSIVRICSWPSSPVSMTLQPKKNCDSLMPRRKRQWGYGTWTRNDSYMTIYLILIFEVPFCSNSACHWTGWEERMWRAAPGFLVKRAGHIRQPKPIPSSLRSCSFMCLYIDRYR